MKRVKVAFSLFALSLLLGGCSTKKDEPSVYYLNFKPEAAKTWEAIAEAYTAETDIAHGNTIVKI